MDGSDEYGVTTDAVHVDTCAGLEVVQVDVTKFGNKIDDIIFWAGLLKNHKNDNIIHLFEIVEISLTNIN